MHRLYGGFEIYDDDDVELLEVRDRKRARVNLQESDQSSSPPESHSQATASRKRIFRETLSRFQSKMLSEDSTNKEMIATSKPALEDEIMTDSTAQLTEKDFVQLPSLRQLLPKGGHTPEPEGNIDRPHYNEWLYCDGFVAWWDNRTGKGMIIDHRNHLEHKIELKDIKWSNYGALVPGSMVEYEYYDDGMSKGFSKFWVVSGCEYVLFKDAWADDVKYLYMQKVKREYYESGRGGDWRQEVF